MSSETLKPLTRKRGTVKAKLTIFNNYLKSIKDTLNKQTPPRILDEVKVAELQQRIEVSSNIIYEFNETQDKIEATVEEKHLEEQYNERADFEQLFYESIAAARVFLSSHTKREENHTTLTPINDNNQRVNTFDIRLPRIELPDFSGSFEQWVPFRDTFNSIIHENSSLPDIQKLHYLNAALTGEAKQIIQSLEISANNYAVAWKLLKDRYENERLIVRGHVKALFELPLITKETSHKLRQLCDGTVKHIRALNALESPEDAANSILIHLLTMKLDHNTQREWEASNNSSKLPTVDELTEFLSQKCQILEALEGNKTQANNSQPKASYRVNAHTATVAQQPCPQCQGEHFIFKCPTFLKKTTADRVNTSKQLKLCLNCLRPNHFSRDCKSTSTCRTCSKRHNSLLHHNEEETKSKNTPPTKRCVANSPGQVLLSTAMVIVRDSNGREFDCRALLDSGSQAHFMTKGLSDKLKTKTHKINYPITGIGQKLTSIKEKAEITIKSKYNGFKVKLNCLIIPQIIETTPSVEFEKAALNIPSNLKLADPQFHQPRPVDILIGADLFYSLLCIGQFKTAPKQVVLQKTKLGWIASGSINSLNQYDLNSMCCAGNKQEPTLEDKTERFWKQEEAEVKKHLSIEEMQCEEHYISTVARDKDGRYHVRLPKRQNKQVGDSYETAKKRLLALERRLKADEQTRAEYHKFLVEYEALGHMTIYNETNEENMSYYVPHLPHAVYKASSSTTRVRVVFDGSAKSSNGVSLNDILMVGPTIQDDLFSILIRFRTYTFVVTADIEKMYRQVNVNSEDRSLQKILWRRHSSEPVKTYVLNTVTYGTSCASFLAIRTLKKLAEDEASTLPEVAKIINSDFYVDDLITGASTIEKACELQKNITNVLAKGQFPLRKWRSNHPMIQSQTTDILNLDKEDIQKTLGLNWNSTTDEFLYNVEISELPRITKRSILSTIAKIYDPLGLIGPVLIIAKLIMQQLWQLNINWDESIPIELHTKWNEIYKGLQDLNALKIPRYINPNNNIACEMHGFADASESAYGACIYIRYPNNEKTTVTLLCSKARVAPLKSVSLPRLELCGAVLLAQLINKLTRIIHLKIDRIYCWTDSTITLHWINMQPNTLKTYVANRVAEIQTLIPEAKWKHVPSNSNPADVISRGSTPTTLLECKLWWAGPEWLIYDEQQWPRSYTITTENVEFNSEVKVSPEISLVSAVQDNNVSQVMQRYSSFIKLQRVVAYCLRFTQNATPKAEKSTKEYLTLGELQRATTKILQFVQKTYFQKELNDLEQNRLVNKQSKLVSLNPFLDKDGLIRVGGRLSNSQLSTDHKHPVVLPSDHHVTRIIMRNEHISKFHCGEQALVSYIRLKYWPLSCKNLAKGITRNCVTCYKYKPKPIEHIMGNLPEVVTDLTAESYLAAFRRFTARRGLPSDVYSDNGTNFVKANRELNEIFNSLNQNQDLIIKELIKCNVKWHFIPPRSPRFGGLWEAAVKSVKQHLTKILKNILLTYEEFITLVIQIEACVNFRPLTALSDDPNDLNVLTPSHFLIGDSLFAPCEYVYEHVKDNLLTRWQHLLKMRQHFWRRWSTEYLHQMQQRTKLTSGNEGLKMGSLVILMDDNLPPQRWPVGRIVELFPGKDNIVRVVSVKTVSGVYKRAVKKVCLLPVNV